MTRGSAPKGAPEIVARQLDQHRGYPTAEVECRIEGALVLLTAAQAEWIDHDLAEIGAIGLLDAAKRHLLAVA